MAISGLIAALSFSISTLFTAPPAVLDSSEFSLPIYSSQVQSIQRAELNGIGASSYVLLNGLTGELVAGYNEHERRAPASTTKIATALVTLENAQLDRQVEVKVNHWELEDSSVMGLVAGERLTILDLLYGLMLPSGNDAAAQLALSVSGGESEFVARMNALVDRLGLVDTHFTNPHGLDEAGHYTSAYDLAQMARAAANNRVFATLAATRQYTVHGAINTYEMQSTNLLLSNYPGADGVKTGYTELAGQCLVFTASRNGDRAVGAVLDSDDRFGESARLLDHYFDNFISFSLMMPNSRLTSLQSNEKGVIHLQQQPLQRLTLYRWQLPYIRRQIWVNRAPSASNSPISGFVAYYLGTRLLAEAPVFGR